MDEQLEIYKRAQAWHDKLQPFLEEEAKRPVFDEHKYRTHVLNLFQLIGQKILFKDMVKGLPQEEVARYFSTVINMVIYS